MSNEPIDNNNDAPVDLTTYGSDTSNEAPQISTSPVETSEVHEHSTPDEGTETPATSSEEPTVSHEAAEGPREPIVDVAPLSSQMRGSKTPWSSRISLLLVAALVGGLAGHFASSTSSSTGGVTINAVNSAPGSSFATKSFSIPKLVQQVQPSVVSIDVKGNGTEDHGTGMTITSNGLVVPNYHVIAAAVNGGTITVTRTGTTKSMKATLVGTNPIDDVALIRIDNVKNLPTVTFGNSNSLVVGDPVVAIGNALGLAAGTPTVTSGIVSAMGRTVTAGTSSSTETLNNMIQTDAAINPGNSGGPLLDAEGDVVGMNTAVAGTLSDGSSAQNIGFAIPVATIESLLKSLKAGASVVNHGAFIGVEITSMTPALQSEYGFSVSTGAVVMSVIAGTGAASAGVKQGDIIVGINSTTINSTQDVSSVVSSLHPGDQITLKLVRGTKHISLKVTLGTQPTTAG